MADNIDKFDADIQRFEVASKEDGLLRETAAEFNVHNAIEFDDPHKAALENSPETALRPSLTTMVAIFSLCLSANAAIVLPVIVVPAILTQIGLALGDTANVSWIPASWAVTASVSACVAGRLSDIFGRRLLIMTGQGFAIVGAIVAAAGQDIGTVIAGASLLGVSCGLILVIFAAIPELVPFKYRGASLACLEAVMAIPFGILAVMIGTKLVQNASWRWCYIISAIYGVLALSGTAIFYFPPARPRHDDEKTRWQEFVELDFIGLGLYTTGLTICLIGLSWAGSQGHPWRSASVVAPIVIGVVTLGCSFAYDWLICDPDRAFFPWRIFRMFRQLTITLITVFVSGMIYYSMSSLIPGGTFYMFSNNPDQIGIISLPNGFGQFVGAVVIPALMTWTKHPKWNVVVGLFLQALFTALLAIAVPFNKPLWMVCQGISQGCFTWVLIASIVNSGLHVQHSDLGLTSGLIATFRSAGGSLGDAIFTTILNTSVSSQLGPRISEAALAAGYSASNLGALIPAVIENALGIPEAFATVPDVTDSIQEVTSHAFREAYGYAYKRVFWATIPFTAIALVFSLFIADTNAYLTNHTAVVLEKNLVGDKSTYVRSRKTQRQAVAD